MVQQFFYTQLQTQFSSTWQAIALTVVYLFHQKMFTIKNIVWLKKILYINKRNS